MEPLSFIGIVLAVINGILLTQLPDPNGKEKPLALPCILSVTLSVQILLFAVCTLDPRYPVVVALTAAALLLSLVGASMFMRSESKIPQQALQRHKVQG